MEAPNWWLFIVPPIKSANVFLLISIATGIVCGVRRHLHINHFPHSAQVDGSRIGCLWAFGCIFPLLILHRMFMWQCSHNHCEHGICHRRLINQINKCVVFYFESFCTTAWLCTTGSLWFLDQKMRNDYCHAIDIPRETCLISLLLFLCVYLNCALGFCILNERCINTYFAVKQEK